MFSGDFDPLGVSFELTNSFKVIPGEAVATQHRMLVMEMKAVRKRTSPRERTKRTRWWKLNQEDLKDAFISKAWEHLSSLEADGKETKWKETYYRIMQLIIIIIVSYNVYGA